MDFKRNVFSKGCSNLSLSKLHPNPSQENNNKGRFADMDIKLLPLNLQRAKLMTIVTLVGAGAVMPVSAQEFLCDATQASAHELPLLSASCPIGKGLWGKQQPKGDQSTFWIQCGVLAKPLTLEQAKVIYPHISGDVWAKVEGKNARCLIGPYQDFTQASIDLRAVKQLKPYQQAFIREVVKGAPPSVVPARKIAAQAQASKPAKRQSTTIIPPSKPAPIAAAKPIPKEAAAPSNKLEISIRREIKIGDVSFSVPYLPLSDEQFYMEYDKPWSRLDFAMATKVCQQLDMSVPSQDQWQTLLAADVMQSNQWPMHLPYWGSDHTALFTSGKITHISGKSLLNIMCVSN